MSMTCRQKLVDFSLTSQRVSWRPVRHALKLLQQHCISSHYLVDVLCRQQIKLFQVVSTSEFHEYQWNNVVFIFFVPSGFWWASEASNIDCFKN